MEIKNLEDLKTAYPDLCAQLENSARQEGQAEERERLQAIDDVAGVVSPELLNAAKYGEPTDAKDLLFKAAKAGELVNKAWLRTPSLSTRWRALPTAVPSTP